MTRLSMFVLSAVALTGCAGLPPTRHPLFIARPAEATAPDPAAASVVVEMNNLLLTLPAATIPGCLAGDYVRKGNDIEVELRQAASTTCEGPSRPFITRIGPLPPGSYQVTVTLDGRPLVRAERAVIS